MNHDMRATHVPLLVVEGGIHRAAIVEISVGEANVGSDAANQVVVSDVLAPTAFRLKWDSRSLVLSAVGCDAEVDGKTLRRGQARRLRRSSSLVVGGIAFSVKLPMTGESRGLLRSSRSLAGGVAGAAALVTTALIAAPILPPPLRFPGVSREMPETTGSVKSAIAPEAKQSRYVAALLQDFRRHLASCGLDNIAVDVQPDGAVEAVGLIVPAKGEAWRAAMRWFDTAAAGRAVLVDRVSVAVAVASLRVQAVYTGLPPYVIDGEGQKLFIGATLPDGSVIQKIENQSVVVKRGDQLVAVRF